ncbi:uncharacterized protein LOC142558505 [Dermacentor variabilis]|uniref:uncharacterized protein LOC142558505 n=1 Tax=Dermacentor variabilis TaxID=34621 RepID=UPI003F5B1B2C
MYRNLNCVVRGPASPYTQPFFTMQLRQLSRCRGCERAHVAGDHESQLDEQLRFRKAGTQRRFSAAQRRGATGGPILVDHYFLLRLHPKEGSSGAKSVSSVSLPKLVPKTSAESVNAQTSNGERPPSLLLVPKSSDEVLAALSDDQQPPQVPHFSDDRHFSSVSLGYRSNDQADIVSGQPQDKRSHRFFDDMAKKPSTSSLDRSDIVDFVVDNRTTEETRAIYNSWAPNYDEDMTLQKYKAPSIMAHFINQELQVKKDAVILDVGSGTGLLGVQLKNLGYSYMDALDYSEEMMSEAKKKSLYKRHFLEKVSKNNKLSLRDAEYDVVALCGCLMPGHIMPDALAEVARLLKPGGRLMWVHRTLDHYESKSEQFLETRFTGTLQALCRQFRMEIAVRKKVQEYRLKCDGQIFALKKK